LSWLQRERFDSSRKKNFVASEHDKFAAHLYRSRREYRLACDRAGKSGKQIERSLISTFKVAESIGFKGDIRQWQELLRIGD
jgi:hypothetical protein